jgi:uncharacterized protein with von Willebrand factor type A (vWA) domain
MSGIDERELMIRVFLCLRRRDFELGVGDLRDALRLLDGEWSFDGPSELRQDVRRLWCHSWEQEHTFDEVWAEEEQGEITKEPPPVKESARAPMTESNLSPQEAVPQPRQSPGESPVEQPSEAVISTIPIKMPAHQGRRAELAVRWPLSPRAMAYGWQYLRRSRADGSLTVVDLEATITRIARAGYFTAPVYRRKLRHHGRLVLLIDRRGSMMPFHSLTDDLLVTARQAPTLEHVQVFYFHDVVAGALYADPLLNESLTPEEGLQRCGPGSSLLIVSDAGAARGNLDSDRVLATVEMIAFLRQHTPLLGWLNPMPPSRWTRTSAQLIRHLLPMFHLDQDGLTDAIKIVRGKHSRGPRPSQQ